MHTRRIAVLAAIVLATAACGDTVSNVQERAQEIQDQDAANQERSNLADDRPLLQFTGLETIQTSDPRATQAVAALQAYNPLLVRFNDAETRTAILLGENELTTSEFKAELAAVRADVSYLHDLAAATPTPELPSGAEFHAAFLATVAGLQDVVDTLAAVYDQDTTEQSRQAYVDAQENYRQVAGATSAPVHTIIDELNAAIANS